MSTNYKDPPPPYPGIHNYPSVPPVGTTPYPSVHPAGPPPGLYGPPQYPGYNPNYGATSTTVIVTQPDVVVIGACPACRIGVLEDDFTCLGVLCAILFFPLGILCCLALREKRCCNCGATFG